MDFHLSYIIILSQFEEVNYMCAEPLVSMNKIELSMMFTARESYRMKTVKNCSSK